MPDLVAGPISGRGSLGRPETSALLAALHFKCTERTLDEWLIWPGKSMLPFRIMSTRLMDSSRFMLDRDSVRRPLENRSTIYSRSGLALGPMFPSKILENSVNLVGMSFFRILKSVSSASYMAFLGSCPSLLSPSSTASESNPEYFMGFIFHASGCYERLWFSCLADCEAGAPLVHLLYDRVLQTSALLEKNGR
jgi:hypothetical protein